MKRNPLSKNPLATLALAGGLFLALQAQSQDLTYAGFDTDTQGASYAWGIGAGFLTSSWDSTLDSSNNVSSGSLKSIIAWPASAGYQELNQSLDIAVPDLSLYDKFSMDVKVDPASLQTTNGNYGTVRVALRGPGYSWNGWLAEPTLTTTATNGWYHYEYAVPATIPSIVQINLGFGGGNYTGPITYSVDNIKFIAKLGPPPPPTLAIAKAGPGLEIRTTGPGDYARKNIATIAGLGPVLGWLNSTGAVTYAMTINESVKAGSAGFAANLMLAAGTDLTIGTSPDWNQPSGIFMEATPNTNGTIEVTVRYKTNAPASHGIRFGDEGLLINLTNTGFTTLVGTWALTLSNDTVALSGPGGISGNAVLPAAALSWFGVGNNVWALFGAQPYAQNDRSISLSRVHIYGAGDFVGTVDQNFTATTVLDPNLEVKIEGDGGVALKPTNTAWRVSWGLPDTGLSLWSSPTVKSNYVESTQTLVTQGSTRVAFTTNSPTGARFFQLRTASIPPAPPYLLESFEAASPFPAASSPYFDFEPSVTAGVTEGANSLHVSYTNDTTWAWRESTDYGAAGYAAWKTHTKLVFDLHRAAFTDGWNLNFAVAMDGTAGWYQPADVVNWVYLNAGVATTETITVNYSSVVGAAPATGTSWKLNFMLRGNGGDANGHCGDVYIDNIRFEN